MAVANRTITFPSLVAGVQTIPWVATVTLAPVNCRGNASGSGGREGEVWNIIGSLTGWTITTHPRWRLVFASWLRRERLYENGELEEDYTARFSFHPPITFPDPNPANWVGNWWLNEERWFAGQTTWINPPSYIGSYYEVFNISDIKFEFEYTPFPPNPLRDPDTNLIIRNANGIIMRGP